MKLLLLFALLSYVGILMTIAANAVILDLEKAGVKADGVGDTSLFIQNALDATAAQGGGVVNLPTGKYRLDKAIVVPTSVTLAGAWETPHLPQQAGGTVLLAYADKGNEDGPALIQLKPSSAVKGLTIYHPEQRVPDVIPYPWAIQGEGMHGSVENVTLTNAYKGIDFGTKHNELHYIRNVFGCPLKIGVNIDNCTDIGRVENVHFNPHYWARSEPEIPVPWKELRDYLYNNLIAFDIGFSDWEMITNTFAFGAKIGYRFRKGASRDLSGNGSFLGIAADWAQRAILVEECNPFGLLIQNGQFVGGSHTEAIVEIAASNKGLVQLSNCAFWGPQKSMVLAAGTGSLSLSQCNFVQWDPDKEGLPAITALNGDIMALNCTFGYDGKQILLGPDVTTAVIQGNRFTGSEQIENNSRGDVRIETNVVKK